MQPNGFISTTSAGRSSSCSKTEDHRPVYARLRGPDGPCVDLSEHHDDGTRGSVILIPVHDFDALVARLTARDQPYPTPSIDEHGDRRTLTVYDPFSNRLTFIDSSKTSAGGRVPDELAPNITEVDIDPSAAFIAFTSFEWWRNYGRNDGVPVVIERGEVIFRNPRWPPAHRHHHGVAT